MKTIIFNYPVYSISAFAADNVFGRNGQEAGRFPLHNLENILCFSYRGASPDLMGACVRHTPPIDLSFFTPRGYFQARACGETRGNVLLRREQYRIADDEERSLSISKNFILGKVYNARWVLERTIRDHELRVDITRLKESSNALKESLIDIRNVESEGILRGIEGKAAQQYFGVLNECILQNKNDFAFHGRNRRPPLDPTNALLSFSYSLLTSMCAHALEGVGLDAYVGFMHGDRPGRKSLALDLMEEFRSICADRFVISCINQRKIQPKHFVKQESGAVLLTESGRKEFLTAWRARQSEIITHPFLKEKIPWGLLPYVQALLLARYIRGDLDEYPPFFWK